MDIVVTPSTLQGSIPAVPSKSYAQRQLLCAALAPQTSYLRLDEMAEDIAALLLCLRALGADIEQSGAEIALRRGETPPGPLTLHCGESGAVLRFLLPIVAALGLQASFSGAGRLAERPLAELVQELERHGARCSAQHLPLTVSGQLQAGAYKLPGHISSQYISGLLLALPLTDGESSLELSSPLGSQGYVQLTIAVLRQFGVTVESTDRGWRIAGRQCFCSPGRLSVEGDWSQAALWLAAGALGGTLSVSGLNMQSLQGDRAIVDILRRMGAQVTISGDTITAAPGPLSGLDIDMQHIPDLLPLLAVLATAANGETRLYHAERLRYKESDRLAATARLLNGLGGAVQEQADGLLISGRRLRGGMAECAGDHRLVMAAALAACCCREPVTVKGAQAAAKSYPSLFRHYQQLGGQIESID